ncbi:MAG: hypothetical protein Q9163_002894 [Psora crenata]
MTPESKKQPEISLRGSEFPELGARTLQILKNNIQHNLKQANHPQAKPKAKRTNNKNSHSKVKDGGQIPENKSIKSRDEKSSASRDSQGNGHGKRKQEPAPANFQKQGSKRLRNGELKRQTREQKDAGSGRFGPEQSNGKATTDPDIRDEIKALGGTDEDYQLLAGIESECEVEGETAADNKKLDSKLAKDLNAYVQELGINRVERDAIVMPSDAEEGAGDEDGRGHVIPTENGVTAQSTTENAVLSLPTKRSWKKDHSALKFPPLSEWHAASLPPLPASSEGRRALPLELIDRLHTHAKALLEKENLMYKDMQRSTSSSHQFYSTIMSSGTLSDKIGALTLSVQESPLHNMEALEKLVGLARKRSRAQSVEVLGALKDLFGPGNLLPSDRKLRAFAAQPALSTLFSAQGIKWTIGKPLPTPMEQSHLLLWAYEDWLKSTFFEIVRIIETWCNDEIVFARGKAVEYVYSLLKEKPEQEANLLRLLVNKLGDSDKKIASKTSFNILQLETAHPSMKPIIVSAIESDLLFRPGQSLHAKYYATITLNQTVLGGREEGLAKKLLNIYFALFLNLLQKRDETKSGVAANPLNAPVINKRGELQGGGGTRGKKARKKQAGKERSHAADEDLCEKVLSAVLTGVNRALPFANIDDDAFEKQLDTLFRLTHSSNFNTSIQALMLIQQVQSPNKGSLDRFYRTLYESLLDPRLLTSSKQVLYLNLLFRALRSDINTERIKAFAKRLLQVVTMHLPSFTCGSIYLLRELETVFPILQTFVHRPEEDSSDDEEIFRDVHEDGRNDLPAPTKSRSSAKTQPYNGRKRDPLYANVSHSTLWDIIPLLSHYHPSVSLFADRLLAHAPMPPKPDLGLHTLIHFLDRFVYKNPKTSAAKASSKGVSIMQPLAGNAKGDLLISAASVQAERERPMNSEAFWKQGFEKIDADEVFFHRYFSVLGRDKEKRAEKKAKKAAKKGVEGDSDRESEGDEDEIWKALVKSRPEVDGDGGDEEGFSDMETLEDEEGSGFDGLEDEDSGISSISDAEDAEADEVDGGMSDLADSEEDALLPSDEDLRSDLQESLKGDEIQPSKKRRTSPVTTTIEKTKRSTKRRKLRNLPTFANVEEYEKMLGGDEEEGIA